MEHGIELPDKKILNKDERQSTINMHEQMVFSSDMKESNKIMSYIDLNFDSTIDTVKEEEEKQTQTWFHIKILKKQ